MMHMQFRLLSSNMISLKPVERSSTSIQIKHTINYDSESKEVQKNYEQKQLT